MRETLFADVFAECDAELDAESLGRVDELTANAPRAEKAPGADAAKTV